MSKWPRASKNNLCPICGNDRLCHVLEDGKGGRCYRPGEGKEPPFVHARGSDGAIGEYVIWYAEPPAAPNAEAPQNQKREEVKRARPEDFRPVYARLLELCPLTVEHRQHLRKARKLTDDQIDGLLFASMPDFEERKAIAAQLLKEFGQKLYAAPGFVRKEYGPAIVAEGPGIIIPHLTDGQVDGLQLRLDHPDLQYQVVEPLPQGRQPFSVPIGSSSHRCRLSLRPSLIPFGLLHLPQCSFHSSPFLL